MIKIGQKLTALVMILTFVVSFLPTFAVSTQGAAQATTSVKSIPIAGNANIKNGSKRLSVSLRDSNVKQALRMFADKAGLNIIFHDSVEDKTITLDLVGVTLNDALRMVMQATDLSYFVDGDTLIIMAADKAKELNISKQNMMILPVKYTDATEIASFLNKNIFSINKPGLSNTEIVAVNPARNELLIFGTKSDYAMAKSVLDMLDSPVRITNFKVNHVTPKEMAKNVCTALLKNSSGDDSSSSDSDNDDDDDDNNDDDSDSSGGGGGQSSGLSAGESGGKKVKLGKAKLACATGGQDSQGGAGAQQSQNGPYSFNQNGIKVMYYETLGTVSLIGGSQEQIDTIASFISASDVKQPMAYLEVSIVELNEDGIKDFSNNWSLLTNNLNITLSPSGGGGELPWLAAGKDPEGTLTLTQVVSYLITNGKARTLANPKILVTSGKESIIDLSHDYLKTLKANTVAGTVTTTSYTPELGSDAGIIVSVTPFISRDGYVVMNLAPTYAVTGEAYTNATTGEILATPLIRRNLELSNIRVKDGETLVMGGLIQEHDTTKVEKIPILGDIPGLGFFFRNTHSEKTKEELVIMITPHIIDDSTDMVNAGNNTL